MHDIHRPEGIVMRAVICGAGVAGLTLALQLGRSGWDVLLIDREAAPKLGGFLVDLTGQGLVATERMGLLPKLLELGERVSRVRWVDECGREIADLPVDDHEPRGGTVKVLRGDLEKVLRESLPSNVEVRFGLDVSDIQTESDHVEVTFSPGGASCADLLIGADGVHSRIRELIFGDGGLWDRVLGYDAAAFSLEDDGVQVALAGRLTALSTPGRHILMCPMRTGKIAVTFLHRSTSLVPPDQIIKRLKAVYGDLNWCIPSILRQARNAVDLRYEQATQIKLPTWYRGRIGLLGDACHAYSLLPGQGSSLALAGAAWLGTEIIRAPSVDSAFAWYQTRLMGVMAERRAVARKTAEWLVPANRTDLRVRNGLLRMASMPGVHRLVRPLITGTV